MPALLPTWAATGTIVVPDASKISVGWLLGEKPPHEYMNWWQNLVTQRLNHVLATGVAAWDESITYGVGAYTRAGGQLYRALASSTNRAPATNPSLWLQVTGNATALVTGVVPNARISGSYTGFANITATGIIAGGQFSGGGSGLTNLNASQLSSGTVPNARISGAYTGFTNVDMAGRLVVGGRVHSGEGFYGPGTGLSDLNASALATGIVPSARISGSYTGFANITASGVVTAQRFAGNGSTLTALNADNLTTGTVPNARIFGNYTGFGNIDMAGRLVVAGRAYSGEGFYGPGGGITDLNANNLTAGTIPNARLVGNYSFANLTLSAALSVAGSVTIGGSAMIDGNTSSGRFISTGGSEAAPSFTANGSGSAGMRVANDSTVDLVTNGSRKLRITDTVVAVQNGAVFQGNGSSLTDFDRQHIGIAMAAMETWRVGSLSFLRDRFERTTQYGQIRSGSDLHPANADSWDPSVTVPGNWRCLGYVGTGVAERATLYQRVS